MLNKIFASGMGVIAAGLTLAQAAFASEPPSEFMNGAGLAGAQITFTTTANQIFTETWVALDPISGGAFVGNDFSLLLGQGGDTFSFAWSFQNSSSFEISKIEIDLSGIAVFDTRDVVGRAYDPVVGSGSGNLLLPDIVEYFDAVGDDQFQRLELRWTDETLNGGIFFQADTDPKPVSTPEPSAVIALIGGGIVIIKTRKEI